MAEADLTAAEWCSATVRFSKRMFDVRRDWSVTGRSTYTCPRCGTAHVVTLLDLVRREQRGEAGWPGPEELVGVLPRTLLDGVNRSLEFSCPGCGARRLLFYEASDGPVGSKTFRLFWVIEEIN